MNDKTLIKVKPSKDQQSPGAKKPCLTVLEGIYVGEVFELLEASTLIGRDRQAKITIIDDGVSREHARIELQDEAVFITDLGSTNGTLVNGVGISEKHRLGDGNKIRMGDVLMRFSYQDRIDVEHHASMREMAMKDPLTQIYNRRYFMDLLQREVNYALRNKQPLALILLDLDHFKAVNDTYGHDAGDRVLKEVSQTIGASLRIYDAFARYGGEEFVIMLRTTSMDQAKMIAERVRKLVADLQVTLESKTIDVTISLGVAALSQDRLVTPDELLKAADEKLYEAKAAGRNQVKA